MAFDEAINTFSPNKGASFLTFAELVIKRRTLTFLEKIHKHNLPSFDESNSDNQTSPIDVEISIHYYKEQSEQELRAHEIKIFQHKLSEFDITFNELVEQSPKHQDSKRSAKKIAKLIAEDQHLLEYLFSKKRLPIKEVLKQTDVSRKTIERMRKYLIALVIIYINTEEFIFLRDYLKGV
jgi:RNA polymerase sigma factor